MIKQLNHKEREENKTLKKHISASGGSISPYVNLELPTELTEVNIDNQEVIKHTSSSSNSQPPQSSLIQSLPKPPQNAPITIPVINSTSVIPVNGIETVLDFTNTNSTSTGSIQLKPSNIHLTNDNKMVLPSMNLKPDPPHGVLKGGKKPTYKQYHTLKHNKPHINFDMNQKNKHTNLNTKTNNLVDNFKKYSREE